MVRPLGDQVGPRSSPATLVTCTSAAVKRFSGQMSYVPPEFDANAILVPSGEYAGSASVAALDVRCCSKPAVLVRIEYRSPSLTYATRCPSGENVGCVAPTPVPRACCPVPLAFATEMVFDASTKAISVWSADHDGSVAPVRSVDLPEPSGFAWQTLVLRTPHV